MWPPRLLLSRRDPRLAVAPLMLLLLAGALALAAPADGSGLGAASGAPGESTVSARPVQKQKGRKIEVKVKVRAVEDLEVGLYGNFKIEGRRIGAMHGGGTVAAGETKVLRLRLSRFSHARKRILRALKEGKKTIVDLKVWLGEERTKLSVRLVRAG